MVVSKELKLGCAVSNTFFMNANDTDIKARDSLECVYARGEWIEAPREYFCVCGVCVGMCGCEKITRRGGRGCVAA